MQRCCLMFAAHIGYPPPATHDRIPCAIPRRLLGTCQQLPTERCSHFPPSEMVAHACTPAPKLLNCSCRQQIASFAFSIHMPPLTNARNTQAPALHLVTGVTPYRRGQYHRGYSISRPRVDTFGYTFRPTCLHDPCHHHKRGNKYFRHRSSLIQFSHFCLLSYSGVGTRRKGGLIIDLLTIPHHCDGNSYSSNIKIRANSHMWENRPVHPNSHAYMMPDPMLADAATETARITCWSSQNRRARTG